MLRLLTKIVIGRVSSNQGAKIVDRRFRDWRIQAQAKKAVVKIENGVIEKHDILNCSDKNTEQLGACETTVTFFWYSGLSFCSCCVDVLLMKFSVLSNQVKHHHQGQTLCVMRLVCCDYALLHRGFEAFRLSLLLYFSLFEQFVKCVFVQSCFFL